VSGNGPQPTDGEGDIARRAGERRNQRAFAGWVASRMRARAHERRREDGSESARAERTSRPEPGESVKPQPIDV
jgi:hypothetical protein